MKQSTVKRNRVTVLLNDSDFEKVSKAAKDKSVSEWAREVLAKAAEEQVKK